MSLDLTGLFSPQEFPAPPELLYKYVSADRVDVLRNKSIRYTPLLATNDPFEVRRTFSELVGPQFGEMFFETARRMDVEKQFRKVCLEMGIASEVIPLLREAADPYLSRVTDEVVDHLKSVVTPALNDNDLITAMLNNIATNLLVLSLTEDPCNSVMWAHYAANWSGFVIGMNTADAFFRINDEGVRQIHKIEYFDGMLAEPMEDSRRAFISKSTNWSYEKEWRSYIKNEEAEFTTRAADGSDLHFRRFGNGLIAKIVIGHRMLSSKMEELTALVKADYPAAKLLMARPIALSGAIEEVPL